MDLVIRFCAVISGIVMFLGGVSGLTEFREYGSPLRASFWRRDFGPELLWDLLNFVVIGLGIFYILAGTMPLTTQRWLEDLAQQLK